MKLLGIGLGEAGELEVFERVRVHRVRLHQPQDFEREVRILGAKTFAYSICGAIKTSKKKLKICTLVAKS